MYEYNYNLVCNIDKVAYHYFIDFEHASKIQNIMTVNLDGRSAHRLF